MNIMHARHLPVFTAATLLLLAAVPSLNALTATYSVTENWTATLSYSNWGDQGYSGTRKLSGKQSGSIVVTDGDFQLLDQTGIKHDPQTDTERTIHFNGSHYSIYGGPVMPYVLAGSKLYAVLHLSGFAIKVPLVDGEIPIFYRSNPYQTSGNSLAALSAAGDMQGISLTITVSSTSVWTPAPFAPAIVHEPLSGSAITGAEAVFSVVAVGNPLPAYQWQRKPANSSRWSNLSDGVNYQGSKTATLLIKEVFPAMHGDQFRCNISNSKGNVTTSVVDLTVNPPLITPEIVAGPQNRLIVANHVTVVFSVEATGSGPLQYQWRFQGNEIPGATAPVLTIDSVAARHAGQYDVVVSNAAGTTISPPAVLVFEVPVVVSRIRPDSEGFQLTLTFGAGGIIELVGSSDLLEWQSLAVLTNPEGVVNYHWQTPNQTSVGFVRAREIRPGE